jgi:hypothetical protein
MAVQGTEHQCTQHLWRLLHAINAVFRPVEEDETHWKPVPSIKKFLKGDAYLCLLKTVLGWILDTHAKTLLLLAHQEARLQAIFDDLQNKT